MFNRQRLTANSPELPDRRVGNLRRSAAATLVAGLAIAGSACANVSPPKESSSQLDTRNITAALYLYGPNTAHPSNISAPLKRSVDLDHDVALKLYKQIKALHPVFEGQYTCPVDFGDDFEISFINPYVNVSIRRTDCYSLSIQDDSNVYFATNTIETELQSELES